MEDIEVEGYSRHQQVLPQNSQESTESTGASSLPALVPSSSGLSTATIETDTTSLASISRLNDMLPKPVRINSEGLIAESSSEDVTSTDGSIVSSENTGLNQASKRTASGAIKSFSKASELRSSQMGKQTKELLATEVSNASCADSNLTDVFQMSAQLKTRLKYAMLKVQNGWESQSIEQIETLSANQYPSSPLSKLPRRLSVSSDGYLVSPVGQSSPSKEASRIFQSQMQSASTPAAAALMAVAGSSSMQPPSLAPAPPLISPMRGGNRRTLNTRAPPMLSKPSLKRQSSSSGPPLTPTSALPGAEQSILQNQAEKDAVDSLLFMSSPNNSKNMKYSQESRSTSRPKKVDFEIPMERRS
jgi:hypothetical protein